MADNQQRPVAQRKSRKREALYHAVNDYVISNQGAALNWIEISQQVTEFYGENSAERIKNIFETDVKVSFIEIFGFIL